MQIAIDKIRPASEPIRKSWDEDKLNELAQSIAEQGLIVPIKVRPDGDGYEVVYGHRRLEATRRNGATAIEAIVEGANDTNALVQALIENVQREDISTKEEGEAYLYLKETLGLAHEEISKRVGKARSWITECILLVSDPSMAPLLNGKNQADNTGKFKSLRHALPNDLVTRKAVAQKVADEELTSRQTKRVADSIAAAPSEQARNMLLEHEYSPVIHDPEHIKARAATYGAHDPFYQSNGDKTVQKTWDSTPEVKMAIEGVIEAAKTWTMLIAEIRKMVQVGKIAPEGRSFTASKLRSLAQTLNRFADELDQE